MNNCLDFESGKKQKRKKAGKTREKGSSLSMGKTARGVGLEALPGLVPGPGGLLAPRLGFRGRESPQSSWRFWLTGVCWPAK